jgi:hypothetical protein
VLLSERFNIAKTITAKLPHSHCIFLAQRRCWGRGLWLKARIWDGQAELQPEHEFAADSLQIAHTVINGSIYGCGANAPAGHAFSHDDRV